MTNSNGMKKIFASLLLSFFVVLFFAPVASAQNIPAGCVASYACNCGGSVGYILGASCYSDINCTTPCTGGGGGAGAGGTGAGAGGTNPTLPTGGAGGAAAGAGAGAAAGGSGTTINLPNPLGVGSLTDLMNKVVDGLILFATPVAVVMVIYAGYLFMNSKGEPAELTKARATLLYAIVGYGILLIAKGIGLIIKNFLLG